MRRDARRIDVDERLVRRTAVSVGVWITVAISILVIVVLIAAFSFVFHQIPLADLFDRNRHEETITVGGLDVVIGSVVLGVLAVVLAGTLGLLATRRAVAPLVDALGRQRRFVADASHELRTPLAILDARLQMLQRELPREDPRQELVSRLRGDSHNLISVVNDLLGSIEPTGDDTGSAAAVAPIVQDAVSSMTMLAGERSVQVIGNPIGDELHVATAPASLSRALVALIDNAVKHTPDGRMVVVDTTADRAWVNIAVVDQGTGISGIDPSRVFDRFARSSDAVDGGGNARSGFGIGLSLVQDTVGRFGGQVEVTRTSADGTTITMRLPRVRR